VLFPWPKHSNKQGLVSDFEAGNSPKDLGKADIVALACKYGIDKED
jgi:hypothetical protein